MARDITAVAMVLVKCEFVFGCLGDECRCFSGDCRRDVHGRETGPSCRANMYLTSGFVWLQNAVDTALIKVG